MAGADQPASARLGIVPRLSHVDQLRALAALYVATFHALLLTWPGGGAQVPWYLEWAHHGHFGVTAFIVLSGFSLALKPAVRAQESAGQYWRFMLRRALRMLPPYWVALAGSFLLLYLLPNTFVPLDSTRVTDEWTGRGPVPLRSVFAFFFLIQDGVKVRSANMPFWSIAIEWHLYFLFPLLIVIGCRFGMKWMIGACAVGGVGILVAYYIVRHSYATAVPQYLVLFGVGIVTAYALASFMRGTDPARWIADLNGWLLVAASFAVYVFLASGGGGAAADLVAGSIFAVGVYALSRREESIAEVANRSPRAIGGRALVKIGLVSYSLYLVHLPVEKVVLHFVVEPLGLNRSVAFIVLTIAGVGASLVGAYLMYVLIERRSMNWSRRVRAVRVDTAGPTTTAAPIDARVDAPD